MQADGEVQGMGQKEAGGMGNEEKLKVERTAISLAKPHISATLFGLSDR